MAAGDPGSPARYYSSTAVETSLQSSIPAQSQGASNTSFIVASVSGFPQDYPYTLIVDPDTSKEEVLTVTSGSSTTLTVTRGVDNTQAVGHSAGAVVRHGVSGRDFRESENHIAARGYDIDQTILNAANQTHVHGIATGDGVIVGTDKEQTLNNKTIGANGLKFEGATDNAFETTLNVEDPTADRTITFPNTSGTVTILDAAQTLSNKTLGSNLAAGTYKITGLGDPSSAQDAATKNYVDTGVSSGVAQAAASATAAATSATSAAASATAAATSATSAAASATAAATSASSASTSATAAATSATSAAASASAASTSATAAATSATSAAASATAAATSATSAAASATAAATSATSAAASATSAAASFDQFDDIYLGAKSSPPSVDNDGNALQTGALYWNTSTTKMYVWSGTAWGEISSSADIIAYKYTATAGQTSVSGADDNGLTLSYVVGKEQVYINGVLQVRGSDYTATTGSSITGMAALTVNDVVTVLAFTAFSVANTIGISTLSAKGNILTASASSTPAVIAVGSNDQVLVADSSTSTGLAWKSYGAQFVAGKNKIINGDFSIWQRGTSFTNPTTETGYTADRFTLSYDGSGATRTISQQTFTAGTAPIAGYEGQFFYRYNQSVAGTGGTYNNPLMQKIENVRTFANQTVTVSFWAKADATRTLKPSFWQNFGSGGSTDVFAQGTDITLTTSWTRYSQTFSIPSISGKTIGTSNFIALYFVAANNTIQTIDIWGVQVEAGSTATPFTTATGTLQGELAACQRYYARFANGSVYSRLPFSAWGGSSTLIYGTTKFPQTMRVAPTSVDYSTLAGWDGGVYGISNVTMADANLDSALFTFTSTGVTQYRPYMIINNNSTSAYIGFSAEL